MNEKDMTQAQITDWKLELANAIISEARFSNCQIWIGKDIDHQLGTVWVGDVAISVVKTESLDD